METVLNSGEWFNRSDEPDYYVPHVSFDLVPHPGYVNGTVNLRNGSWSEAS